MALLNAGFGSSHTHEDYTSEWCKRLDGENYNVWISAAASSAFTIEKIQSLCNVSYSGHFQNLPTSIKMKLILAICNISARQCEQWVVLIDNIFNVALSESDESWVKPIAEILYTLPSLGYLRTGLDENKIFADVLQSIKTKRPWTLSLLPLEIEYVNHDAIGVSLKKIAEFQNSTNRKHFTIVRKPKSVAALGNILEKAKREDAQQKRYTAPIKMRSFAKKLFDESDDTPYKGLSQKPLGSTRLPGAQIRRQVSLRQSSGQQRTTQLIDISEQPAVGKAAKAKRRAEENERRKADERASKRALEEEQARTRAAAVEEAHRRQSDMMKMELSSKPEEMPPTPSANYAAGLDHLQSDVFSHPVQQPQLQQQQQATPQPPSYLQPFSNLSSYSTNQNNLANNAAPAYASHLQAQDSSLSFMQPILPSNQQSFTLNQPSVSQAYMQNNGLFTLAAKPSTTTFTMQPQTPTVNNSFAFNPNSNVRIVQVANLPPIHNQFMRQTLESQQQQPPQQQHSVTPSQGMNVITLTHEQQQTAQEIFSTANKLTKPEKSVILSFIAGNRTNFTPHLGNLVRIHLSEYKERVFDQDNKMYKEVVADQYFQMDYASGQWTIVKRYKEASQDVLSKLDYVR